MGPPVGDDHGDSRGSATHVAPGSSRSGELTAGDRDWFRVTVDQAGSLEVYTTGSTDTVGSLQNAGGTELANNDDAGEGRNFRIERTVSAGAYYVQVRGFSRSTTGRYTLHVRFNASSPGDGGDGGDDHGDTRADATSIAVDTNFSIEVTTNGALTAGDTDYFRVTVDRAGTLLVWAVRI